MPRIKPDYDFDAEERGRQYAPIYVRHVEPCGGKKRLHFALLTYAVLVGFAAIAACPEVANYSPFVQLEAYNEKH